MASATETQASRIQLQVQKILEQKGLTITRTRPPLELDTEEEIITIKGFLDPQRRTDSTAFSDLAGLVSEQSDDHSVLIDGFTDVIEGDQLTFSNLRWRVVRVDYQYLGDTVICRMATVRRQASDSWIQQ